MLYPKSIANSLLSSLFVFASGLVVAAPANAGSPECYLRVIQEANDLYTQHSEEWYDYILYVAETTCPNQQGDTYTIQQYLDHYCPTSHNCYNTGY